MAPTDKLHLPFRWEFAPVRQASDGAVRWIWRAYTQTGVLAMDSSGSFETLTECMDDAKTEGWGQG
jgi:hypothetical protein